ncbi:hypothetical protein ACJJTC_002982 [Scirpophaga incertulas]
MAVRSQHMLDGGIVERRLRPIYDWLDNGNNKKALQEAEKVLKKSPTLQAARALKALALFRLGKTEQAHALLDELATEKLCDDTTLQAMTITYRESQQLHKVCGLYETAVKLDPNNEELHSHLFMSYVRIGDFKSQQRAAMALYKFAPKNPYYFWAVMSIVLQAKTAEDPTRRGILLSLAQRMVDNFISDNKMEAEQEARLYIMILELQEKWEDILKFIESPLYSQLVPGPIAHACIPYLKKLGHWSRLNILCKDLLWDNQDRWDYYLPYFDSVFHLIKESDMNTEDSADNTAEKCHEFICQLVESMTCGRTLRGPYLARLELYKRLVADGDPTALLGSGVALCVQYLRVFANKPCAVPDLKLYLAMIPQKEREEQARDFLTCLGFEENSEPDNIEDIQRHISCIATWRLAAAPLEASENLALANTLRGHYLRSLAKGLVTTTATEFCSADSYALLAAHHYFYAAMQQQNSRPVVEALSLLELTVHHSPPPNFHAKLLLLKLYHLIGNALAADSAYQMLQIKHIQVMSLGWLHAARLPAAATAATLCRYTAAAGRPARPAARAPPAPCAAHVSTAATLCRYTAAAGRPRPPRCTPRTRTPRGPPAAGRPARPAARAPPAPCAAHVSTAATLCRYTAAAGRPARPAARPAPAPRAAHVSTAATLCRYTAAAGRPARPAARAPPAPCAAHVSTAATLCRYTAAAGRPARPAARPAPAPRAAHVSTAATLCRYTAAAGRPARPAARAAPAPRAAHVSTAATLCRYTAAAGRPARPAARAAPAPRAAHVSTAATLCRYTAAAGRPARPAARPAPAPRAAHVSTAATLCRYTAAAGRPARPAARAAPAPRAAHVSTAATLCRYTAAAGRPARPAARAPPAPCAAHVSTAATLCRYTAAAGRPARPAARAPPAPCAAHVSTAATLCRYTAAAGRPARPAARPAPAPRAAHVSTAATLCRYTAAAGRPARPAARAAPAPRAAHVSTAATLCRYTAAAGRPARPAARAAPASRATTNLK